MIFWHFIHRSLINCTSLCHRGNFHKITDVTILIIMGFMNFLIYHLGTPVKPMPSEIMDKFYVIEIFNIPMNCYRYIALSTVIIWKIDTHPPSERILLLLGCANIDFHYTYLHCYLLSSFCTRPLHLSITLFRICFWYRDCGTRINVMISYKLLQIDITTWF